MLPPTVSPEALLQDLLAVSLTAVNLLRPLYDPAGELVDFAPEYFNPAAQRMTGLLTERPVGTARTLFPDIFTNGVFAFYRRVFESGEASYFEVNYQADGLDNYFRVAARRSGELLLVSFTDTADQDRSAVELALRDSQAAEKAARAEAETQRQRFYDLLMQLPAQVATYHGPDHTYNFVNAAYRHYFPTQALPGRSLREVLPEAESQGVLALMNQVYQTGKPSYQQELEVWLDFDGSGQPRQLFLNLLFHPLRDAQGCVDGLLDFSYDVTEQVLARRQVQLLNQELETRVQAGTREALALQAELLAAAQRQVQVRESFYQIFEQTPAAVSLLRGPSHRFEYINPVCQQVFADRQLVGRDFAEALPDAAEQGYLRLLDGVYHTGETFFGAEVPFVSEQPNAPSYTTYFNFTYQAYRENGEIAGVSTFALDVTEQVLARQERETQRQRLHQVFEQAPVAICVFNGPEYVLEVVNPQMLHLWGRTSGELIGRPFFEAMPELRGQGLAELLAEVRRSGQPFTAQEMEVRLARHAPGQRGVYNFVYAPVRNDQGQVVAVTCVTTDVTEQVEARQQVQVLNEELRSTNAELHTSNQQLTRTNVDLDTFVYTASHDLKAPITNIESIVLALRDMLPAEVQQEESVAHLLDLLDNTTARFQLTIAQLTDLTKLQLAHAGPAEPVVLAQVIESVRLDLAPVLEAAAAHLTLEVAPALVVSFSPANLRSTLYNLLSNAVKYRSADRPAQVRIHAEPTPQGVVLTVQDNGLGLNEHQQQRLFGLFQRLHTHVDGTGVGLYITKRLVENGGGTIAVESQVNVGTTFTLTFPA